MLLIMKISSDWSCSLEKGDGKLLTKTWKLAWLCEKIKNKAIEEICRKSPWHASLSRLAAVRVISLKKPFLDKVNWSICAEFQVYIVYRFSFGQEAWHNTYIHTYTCEIRIILDRLLASRGFWYLEIHPEKLDPKYDENTLLKGDWVL